MHKNLIKRVTGKVKRTLFVHLILQGKSAITPSIGETTCPISLLRTVLKSRTGCVTATAFVPLPTV